jgi:hypothetical protein
MVRTIPGWSISAFGWFLAQRSPLAAALPTAVEAPATPGGAVLNRKRATRVAAVSIVTALATAALAVQCQAIADERGPDAGFGARGGGKTTTGTAHGSRPPGAASMTEEEIYSYEVATLGEEHAKEHAAARKARVSAETGPAGQADENGSKAAKGHGVEGGESHEHGDEHADEHSDDADDEGENKDGDNDGDKADTKADAKADVGEWTTAPFDLPHQMAINAVMLRTGKVLMFSYPKRDFGTTDYGSAVVWDPSKGTGADSFKQVPPPIDPDSGKPANIFCAGQAVLDDGRVLVVGGNLRYENESNHYYAGLNRAYVFNPGTETWQEQPRMRHGRWYPTLLKMADGRVAVISGSTEQQTGQTNRDFEVFTPGKNGETGTWTMPGGPDALGSDGRPPTPSLYPQMVWMNSGRGLVAGPGEYDTWFFTPPGGGDELHTQDAPDLKERRSYGNALPLPNGTAGTTRVLETGGYSADGQSKRSSVVMDENDTGKGWAASADMNVPRSNHNTKILPDGSMVAIGGGKGADLWTATEEHKHVELWNPKDGKWTLGPKQVEVRAYHSTAVLLPDGRVLSSGDDVNTSGTDENGNPRDGKLVDTGEIYSPPYLFKGKRPIITKAPNEVGLGKQFTVNFSTAEGAPATKAVLVAPSAVTHAVDTEQRYVELAVAGKGTGSVTLKAPAAGNVAPPGYYMLFLLTDDGVPSVAKFVRIV